MRRCPVCENSMIQVKEGELHCYQCGRNYTWKDEFTWLKEEEE